jgi:hypothetical protein
MKKSVGKSDSKDGGDMRLYSVQLPARIADSVENLGRSDGLEVEEMLQQLIVKTVEDKVEPLGNHLLRFRGLISEIVVATKKTPMREEKDAKTGTNVPREERRKKRDHLVELGIEAFDELRKISTSEETARESEFRLRVFQAMARLGSFSAAIIRDQEAEDIEHLISEIMKTNDEFEEKFKELEKERREEERAMQATM